MKISDLSLWEAFVAVAKQGNFAKAARALHAPVPQLSKRVAKLESLLEVRLFARSTRVVKLTDEGRGLMERAVALLEDSTALESSFSQRDLISGTLRITSAPFIAHRLLIPVLKEFRELYPRVEVLVDLSESIYDLIESQFDLALRLDEPEESGFIYRKLFSNDIVIAASPEYLRNSPHALNTPKDLKHHPILMLEFLKQCGFLKRDYALKDLPLNQPIKSENGLFLTEMALKGMGVIIRAYWDLREHIESKRLVRVLPNYPLEPFGDGYAVIPSRKYLAPRVRVFLDLLLERAQNWQYDPKDLTRRV